MQKHLNIQIIRIISVNNKKARENYPGSKRVSFLSANIS